MNARKRLMRMQANKQQKTTTGAKTRNMFGHMHFYDETLSKWVRLS